MHLREVNEALDHRITGGSEYQWNCYPEARYLDFESDYAYVTVLFNTITQEVYEADLSIKREAWGKDSAPYRWFNPDYYEAYLSEAKQKNIDPNQAWDDVKWIILETEEDFLEKATAIFNGEKWDTRIQVPLDLDDSLLLKLMLESHKRDITLNQMVEEILRNMIAKYERDDILNGYEQDRG
jgi:hypothetical protein